VADIVTTWNTWHPKKEKHPPPMATHRAIVAASHEHGRDGLCDAMANYKAAIELPNSQAHIGNLHWFCTRGKAGYLPGAFDIDRYDRAKYDKALKADAEKKAKQQQEFKDIQRRNAMLEGKAI